MRIFLKEVIENGRTYYLADAMDFLPGTPPIGKGRTHLTSVLNLFYRLAQGGAQYQAKLWNLLQRDKINIMSEIKVEKSEKIPFFAFLHDPAGPSNKIAIEVMVCTYGNDPTKIYRIESAKMLAYGELPYDYVQGAPAVFLSGPDKNIIVCKKENGESHIRQIGSPTAVLTESQYKEFVAFLKACKGRLAEIKANDPESSLKPIKNERKEVVWI